MSWPVSQASPAVVSRSAATRVRPTMPAGLQHEGVLVHPVLQHSGEPGPDAPGNSTARLADDCVQVVFQVRDGIEMPDQPRLPKGKRVCLAPRDLSRECRTNLVHS